MDSLVADYGTSSGSDSSDNENSSDASAPESQVPVHRKIPESQKKPALPPPAFDDNSASIFTNPYIEAENAKSAILEKHVKMIPSKEFISEINGKKLCWMYRKGRCRFGSNCKYAHDSELYNQDQSKSEEKPDTSQPDLPHGLFPPHKFFQQDLSKPLNEEDGDTAQLAKRKKRPGLSQSIVPGKKVMKMYYSSNKPGQKNLK